MTPKDLVVFLEAAGHARRIRLAAAIAKRWQAHLIGTFVAQPLDLDPHAGFAVGKGLEAMLETYRAQQAQAADEVRKEFEAICADRSFTSEWRVSEDEDGEALMLHARHACLAILGPPSAQSARPLPFGLSEQFLFASGRPCLLIPDTWRGVGEIGRRVVIGWNGSREATRSIAAATPFLVEADAVDLVVAPEASPPGIFGVDPGADMAAHLARQGVTVNLELIAGHNAGERLLHRCAIVGADLLVIGAMGRSRISEFVFGGATRTVFAEASLPILIAA